MTESLNDLFSMNGVLDDEWETPEEQARRSDPPKRMRGRPRKSRNDGDVVDESAAPKTPRVSHRRKAAANYTDDIENSLIALFDGVALWRAPTWKIGVGLSPDAGEDERRKLHDVAVHFDRWFQGLSDDSPLKKYLAKAADSTPIVFACVGLAQIGFTKYMMEQMYQAQTASEHGAVSG